MTSTSPSPKRSSGGSSGLGGDPGERSRGHDAPPSEALRDGSDVHIDIYMKRMLIEIDDRSARDLERVAPAKERKRAEFVRLAIRRALDLALERSTKGAYARLLEAEGRMELAL